MVLIKKTKQEKQHCKSAILQFKKEREREGSEEEKKERKKKQEKEGLTLDKVIGKDLLLQKLTFELLRSRNR